MNKMLNTLFALAVASVTGLAHAQAAAPAAAASTKAPVAASIDAKIAMCVGCHGIPGYQATFPEVYKVPKISGQSAKYIVAALMAYKQGDRRHPTMRGIADTLTDKDMAEIAAHYEASGKTEGAPALPEKPVKEPSPQVAALLQKAACASCHGSNFSKPIDPAYPKLAGQNADYLFVALKAYKTEEKGGTVGRSNGVMAGMAKQFSNAELKAIANYVGSLDSELKTVPESRFRR